MAVMQRQAVQMASINAQLRKMGKMLMPKVVKVPLLTLQPLLENAIYHGIQPLPEGGTITVRVSYDEEFVNIEISNPLPGDDQRGQSQGNRMAIGNIRSRLQVLYGARAMLSNDERDGRYHTRLRFPMAGPDESL